MTPGGTKPYLVNRMKVRACILIFLWSLLLIEPLSANFNINSNYSCFAEKQKPGEQEQETPSCCSQTSCDEPTDKENENDCEGNRCNPLMSCPTGNFYLCNQSYISISPLVISKQKAALIDDNRISKHLAECWHPPEII